MCLDDFCGSINSTHGPTDKTQNARIWQNAQSKRTLKVCLDTAYFTKN